jgi:hypothetical protein
MKVPEEPVFIYLFRQNPVFYLPAFEISRSRRIPSGNIQIISTDFSLSPLPLPPAQMKVKFSYLEVQNGHGGLWRKGDGGDGADVVAHGVPHLQISNL